MVTLSVPDEYIGVRVTASHSQINAVLESAFSEDEWYICYPHMGKHGDNEHFHIVAAHRDKAARERLRTAVRNACGAGNKFFSIKCYKNGVTHAITYTAKEGTTAITKGSVEQWISDAPAWIPGLPAARKRKRTTTLIDPEGDEFDGGVRVNQYNISAFAAHYHRKHRLSMEIEFDEVIRRMVASQKYTWHFKESLTIFHNWDFRSRIGDPEGVSRLTELVTNGAMKLM